MGNLQRFIIMQILLTLTITLTLELYYYKDTIGLNSASNLENILNKKEETFRDEDNLFGSIQTKQDIDVEKTVGNSVSMSKIIFDLFVYGFNPVSIRPSQFDTVIEKRISVVIMLVRALIMVLAIIEGIMFWKNRKTS